MATSPSNISYQIEPDSVAVKIAMPVLGSVIIVLNAGVLIVLFAEKTLKRDMYTAALLSLSGSDLFVGISLLLYALETLVGAIRNLELCFGSLLLLIVSTCVSTAHITFICAVRIVAIKHPRDFRALFTFRRIALFDIGIWLITFAVIGIHSIFWISDGTAVEHKCALYTAYRGTERITLLIGVSLLLTYCGIIVTYVYLIILIRTKLLRRVEPTNIDLTECRRWARSRLSAIVPVNIATPRDVSPPDISTVVLGTQIKRCIRGVDGHKMGESIRALGVIVALLTTLIVPTSIVFMVEAIVPTMILSQTARASLASVTCLNSAINPFVYPLMVRKFRQAIKRRFRC